VINDEREEAACRAPHRSGKLKFSLNPLSSSCFNPKSEVGDDEMRQDAGAEGCW
jgi:hypothetical protein